MEIWRDVVGLEGIYKISSKGRVFSIRSNRCLKPKIDKYGYKVVTLCVQGKRCHRTIHRLVAEAFIPNLENKPTVNHINEDKLDNSVENLEWATVAENVNHGSRNERMARTKSRKPVIQLTLDGEFITEWAGAKEAGRKTGINRRCISKCCKGERLSAGGYKWMYKEDYEDGMVRRESDKNDTTETL